MNLKHLLKDLCKIAFVFVLGISNVSAEIGKVLVAKGEVSAQRESMVSLKRGSLLFEKDIVTTGSDARANLLMIDGAKITLKPLSELSLEEYKFKKNTVNNVVGSSDKSSLTMSLLKGGFRTISGAIGSGTDKSNYKVKTPIATIGIRGTDYSVLICTTTCIGLDGAGNVPAGVYFAVSSGSIIITNAAGVLVLEKNQYAYVVSPDEAPVRIIMPPINLVSNSTDPILFLLSDKKRTLGDSEVIEGAKLADTDETNNGIKKLAKTSNDPRSVDPSLDDPTSVDPTTVKPVSVDPFSGITIEDIPIGPLPFTGFSQMNNDFIASIIGADEVIVSIDGYDENGNPIRIDNKVYDFTDANSIAFAGILNNENSLSTVNVTPLDSLISTDNALTQFYAYSAETNSSMLFSVGEAQQISVGYDSISGLSWGRWSNNFMLAEAGGGIVSQIDLTNSSFHWLIDNFQTDQELPISGSASYSLVGNTDPTNNFGDVGILGTAAFDVNFTNQTVANSLSLGINESVWSASGTGTIADGSHWFSGAYDNVMVDSTLKGTGSFSGLFNSIVGSNDLPTGAGLVYVLQNEIMSPSETITGTLIFGNSNVKFSPIINRP